jgi:hypothetical protein
VYTEDSNSLYESYLDTTYRPHGHLLLDLAQDTDDVLRFRTATFPSEITVTYAPQKIMKKIKLSAEICETENSKSGTRDLEQRRHIRNNRGGLERVKRCLTFPNKQIT